MNKHLTGLTIAAFSVIPALIAEIVIVVKDTTFSYVVTFPDLMQNSKVLISNYDALVSVYFVIAIIYILINYLLNKVSVVVANHTNPHYVAAKQHAGKNRKEEVCPGSF